MYVINFFYFPFLSFFNLSLRMIKTLKYIDLKIKLIESIKNYMFTITVIINKWQNICGLSSKTQILKSNEGVSQPFNQGNKSVES